MQLPLVLDGHLISHAIGALEQIEAETQRRFLLRGTRSALSLMLAEHALIVLTRILVSGGVAVHGRRAVLTDAKCKNTDISLIDRTISKMAVQFPKWPCNF